MGDVRTVPLAQYLAGHDTRPSDNVCTVAAIAQALDTSRCDKFVPTWNWWAWQSEGMSVSEALHWFALRDSQDDCTTGDRITLSTVHAAKGLEWPVVIVANLNEGEFPSSPSLNAKTPEEREANVREERRLCYVAMTRAKQRLVLHYRRPEDQAQKPDARGRTRAVKLLSRFLSETGITNPEMEESQDGSQRERARV
jgi:superfamily I DNA/RNA helicase